jgi:ankyrin repeat protein
MPFFVNAKHAQKLDAKHLFFSVEMDMDAEKSSMPPLVWAARIGDEEAVKALCTDETALNAPDKNGMTPIMWAAYCGHLSIVEMLCAAGADLSIVSKPGYTTLMWAYQKGHREIIDLLLAALIGLKN